MRLAVAGTVALLLALAQVSSAEGESVAFRLFRATGSVYAEYAGYKLDENGKLHLKKTRWFPFGSAWAYRSTNSLSIWITNAHVLEAAPVAIGGLPDGLLYKPTKRWGIRRRGTEVEPVVLIPAIDTSRDLAALILPKPSDAIECIYEGDVPEETEVVSVSFPLGIRYAVSHGRVMRAHRNDYDGFEKFPQPGGYSAGELWLDMRLTHGSSGAPVVLESTGCLVGVVRGYAVAAAFLMIQMGETIPFAIPSPAVIEFLRQNNL